jgi:hypothetical protein
MSDMSDDDLANLMLLGFDEIDFDSLSIEVLKKLALANELYIATSALGELEIRDEQMAIFVASNILEISHGDKYLQSSALGTLFRIKPEKAIDCMLKMIKTCDPYIFNTILEILLDNGAVKKNRRFPELINSIANRLNNSDISQNPTAQELKEQFLVQFQQK